MYLHTLCTFLNMLRFAAALKNLVIMNKVALKKHIDSSESKICEDLFLFAFKCISSFISFEICFCVQYFIWAAGKL